MAVVILMRASSRRCAAYRRDIQRFFTRGKLGDIPVGDLLIDDTGRFGRWIAASVGKELQVLRYTIVYLEGWDVERFSTIRAT